MTYQQGLLPIPTPTLDQKLCLGPTALSLGKRERSAFSQRVRTRHAYRSRCTSGLVVSYS